MNQLLSSQENEIGYYIAHDGYCYVDTFQREWVDDHEMNQSGPLHCSNCESFGTMIQDGRIIFLGYCLNCSSYIYNNSRGHGFQGFDNITDMETINRGGTEHLEKYRTQIVSYITKYLEDMNFDVQFPEEVQQSTSVPPPVTTVPLNHFDTTACDCDYCDSDDDVNVPQDNYYHYSSDDCENLCDCCHTNQS